ncbi:MAG TPA: sigma 54-interacting transcriptional regulator [Symbiobacteriaceae bacterium]
MEHAIGVISPYPEFTDTVESVARELSLPVRVEQAVLAGGVAAARRWVAEGVRVVVGRGPTAVMLKRVLRVPVVMIHITAYDVMDALYRAAQVGRRIAFVDYDLKQRQYSLSHLGRMLGIEFEPLLYADMADLRAKISEAARRGFDVVVGTGACVLPLVKERGMKGILVHSSREAIHDALVQAREILEREVQEEARTRTAQAVVALSGNGILILDRQGRIHVFNPAAERLFGCRAADLVGRTPEELRSTYPFVADLVGDGQEAVGQVVYSGGGAYVVSRRPVGLAPRDRSLVVTIQPALQGRPAAARNRRDLLDRGLTARYSFADLEGSSPALTEVVARARRYARSDLTVLITGESGTGKEVFAQAIHNASPRAEGPFVAVNCAAIPANLLESELFGYEEGAFTGARRGGAQGVFELAHGGTLFLDEIGEMPATLQASLLRALQERRIRRVGGSRLIPVDVRVIAATNRDLGQMVREGQFREDLYYRLNVLTLHLPPLRERAGDLPVLVRSILDRLGGPPMPPEACRLLETYPWPGNVRELENFLQRYALLAEEAEDPVDLVARMLAEARSQRGLDAGGPRREPHSLTVRVGTLAEMEREILVQLDRVMGHDRTRLSRLLGISRTTLWKRLREYEQCLSKN